MNTNGNNIPMEVLQPEISSQAQETNLEELKSWINEGKIHPSTKVRIKHLLWMEARQIPALQALFESRKSNAPVQPSNQPQTQSFLINSDTKDKLLEVEKSVPPQKPDSPTVISPVKIYSDTTESSVPFQLYEKKVLAKTKQIEEKTEQNQSPPKSHKNPLPLSKPNKNTPLLPKPKRNASLLKNIAGFLAGCILMFLLAWGGSYLWIFQLRSPVKIDEKNVTDLVILENKLTTDKVGLRLKVAASEQEAAANGQENSPPKLDYTQELAKLEKQYDAQRKTILEDYRTNLINNDFNNTFYGSFAVLMILFFLLRILFRQTNQPIENTYSSTSSALQTTASPNIQAVINPEVKVENSHNIHVTKPSEIHITKSSDLHTTNFSNKIETIDEFLQNPEYLGFVEIEKSRSCLMHRDAPSKFVCEICSNYFCAECPQTIESVGNCCPFCKTACKSADSIKPQAIGQPKVGEENKQAKLSNSASKTISNFTMHDFPDKEPYKIGIITAFFIALFFSISIAYFWVYQISPRLEKNEISQNSESNEPPKLEKNNVPKVSETSGNTNTAANNMPSGNANREVNAANQPCIDPITKQSFKCDEETRGVLDYQTKKTKSVEDAQKQVSEKTSTILSLILPSSSPASENSAQEPPNPVEEARKENNKRQFIQIFTGSFLLLFVSLVSTRFFGKKKTDN